MDCGEIQRLWVKGLGYVSDKHVYKFKDYSEAVFDTQIISKKWLCKELKNVAPETNHISILAGWYGLVSIPFLYQTFGEINIDLYDVDEYTTDIARHIFNDYSKVNIHTQDVVFDEIDYKGQIVINIGDMLQEASSGYFPSTIHRVINPKKTQNLSRYSIPLFLHPRPEVILSDRYTADSYLLERLKEIGLK